MEGCGAATVASRPRDDNVVRISLQLQYAFGKQVQQTTHTIFFNLSALVLWLKLLRHILHFQLIDKIGNLCKNVRRPFLLLNRNTVKSSTFCHSFCLRRVECVNFSYVSWLPTWTQQKRHQYPLQSPLSYVPGISWFTLWKKWSTLYWLWTSLRITPKPLRDSANRRRRRKGENLKRGQKKLRQVN